MKFKEITLVNFMRYKGENTIRFSTDDRMNVTAILGNNTVGKTTIAQAFRWGLYGEVISTNYETKEKAVLLNKEVIAEMGIKGTREVLVEITMSDKDDTNEFEYKFLYKYAGQFGKETFRKSFVGSRSVSVVIEFPWTNCRISSVRIFCF